MKVFLSALIIVFYAAISSVGLYKLKAAASPLSLDALIGFIFYAAGFLIWIIILRMMPLSIAFPAAAGTLVICTQITGVYFLNEHIGASHLAGIALIIAGMSIMFARSG